MLNKSTLNMESYGQNSFLNTFYNSIYLVLTWEFCQPTRKGSAECERTMGVWTKKKSVGQKKRVWTGKFECVECVECECECGVWSVDC